GHLAPQSKWTGTADLVTRVPVGDIRSTGGHTFDADQPRELLHRDFTVSVHEYAQRIAALGLEDERLDHGVLGHAERHAGGAGPAVRLVGIEVRYECHARGAQCANRHRDRMLGHDSMIRRGALFVAWPRRVALAARLAGRGRLDRRVDRRRA